MAMCCTPKHSFPVARWIALLAGMIVAAHAAPEAVPMKKANLEPLAKLPASEFTKLVDQSRSPGQRLAVGVGSLDGSKPKWQKIPEEGEEGTFVFDGDGDAANYLVDIEANRVTGVLDSCHIGTGKRYNHESGMFIWSPDGHWLMETQTWKWHTAVCTIHRVNAEGRLSGRLNFRAVAEQVAQQQLRKQFPKLSAKERAQYTVRIEVPTISPEGVVTAKIWSDIPKDEEAASLCLAVSTKIEQAKTGELSAKVLKVEPVKEDKDATE